MTILFPTWPCSIIHILWKQQGLIWHGWNLRGSFISQSPIAGGFWVQWVSSGVSNFLCPRTKTWIERHMGNSRSGDSLPRNNVLPRAERGQSWKDMDKYCTNLWNIFFFYSPGFGVIHTAWAFLFMLYLVHIGLCGKEALVSVPTVSLIC